MTLTLPKTLPGSTGVPTTTIRHQTAKFGLDQPSRLAGHRPHTDRQTDKQTSPFIC